MKQLKQLQINPRKHSDAPFVYCANSNINIFEVSCIFGCRFSLTLIDTLDSLAVLGELEEFEKAVKLVIEDVTFDTDVVVSVFETNIRVLG